MVTNSGMYLNCSDLICENSVATRDKRCYCFCPDENSLLQLVQLNKNKQYLKSGLENRIIPHPVLNKIGEC